MIKKTVRINDFQLGSLESRMQTMSGDQVENWCAVQAKPDAVVTFEQNVRKFEVEIRNFNVTSEWED